MRLKIVNQRILQLRKDGWFWDSQITPELAKVLLLVKDGEEVELKTEGASLCVDREGEKFLVNLEELDEDFETVYSDFILWRDDLEKVANSSRRKPAKETLRSVVNAPFYKKYRTSMRAFKQAVRRAKQRSCFLGGFTEIRSVTSLSAKKFLLQQGFKISLDGEVSHPRGRRNTTEKVSSYKVDSLLRGFGL